MLQPAVKSLFQLARQFRLLVAQICLFRDVGVQIVQFHSIVFVEVQQLVTTHADCRMGLRTAGLKIVDADLIRSIFLAAFRMIVRKVPNQFSRRLLVRPQSEVLALQQTDPVRIDVL